MRQTMNRGDWLRLGALTLLWSMSFLFYRILAHELPPFTAVFGRVALGGAVLFAILRLRDVPVRLPRAQWRQFFTLAALNNAIPFTLFVWGEARVNSGTASILNATTPLFTVLVTGLVWRSEPITAARLAGVACGIAGVAVLVGPRVLLGQDMLGQAACLLAALSYGFGMPYGRRIGGVAPASMAIGQLLAATLLMLPLAVLFDRPWALPSPSTSGWVALIGIAVLCTSLAYVIFFDLLARAGATNLALVTLLTPGLALLLGAAVLGETITWPALAGLALIGAGLAAIDGRLLVTLRAAAPARRPAQGAPPPD